MTREKILLVQPMVHPAGRELLEQQLEIVDCEDHSPEYYVRKIHDVSAVCLHTPSSITREIMLQSPRLKVIAGAGAGIDYIDLAAATELGIPVVHAPGGNAVAVAEHTIGLMLAIAKKIPQTDACVRASRWSVRGSLDATLLDGKVLGLVGLGAVGSAVAEKCRLAFHMRVLACDPMVDEGQARAKGVELVATLDEVLERADFVSLHVPLVADTHHLISSRQIAKMKPTAYLINTSRGAVVDQVFLAKALKEHRIAGAAADVFDPEPPPPDNPLFGLDNIVLTPHSASLSQEVLARLAVIVAERIIDVVRGRRPSHLANPVCWERFERRFAAMQA